MIKRPLTVLTAVMMSAAVVPAWANAVEQLRDFVRDVKSAQSAFVQTVTSADGKKTKQSSGQFEFVRPSRFRFHYTKPFDQLIVADGVKVWIHDTDLNQSSSRAMDKALGATPASLLAGGNLEQEFVLSADKPQPADPDGLQWARAVPKAKGASFAHVQVGFKGKELAAIAITDNFGQRSLLVFNGWQSNLALGEQRFRFKPPPGAEVVEQ